MDGTLTPRGVIGHHTDRVNHPGRVMTARPAHDNDRPVPDTSYEIRIKGRVTGALLDSFGGMESQLEPVETVLHGPVRNQDELHALITRIQALGLELVEVRRLPS
jgi:hypothetical protein